VLFTLMSVIWGVPYLMIKVAVEGGVSVPMVVFTRTAVGAVVLLPLALCALGAGGLADLVRRHWPTLAAFTVVDMVLPWGLLAHAEHRLTSSMTGLLIAVTPILAVLAGRLTGGSERIGGRRWAGLAIGFAGVAVLTAPGLRGGDARAIVEVLLTACGYALGPLLAARRLSDVPGLPMTAVCLTFATALSAGPAAATWPDAMPSGRVLAALAGLAVICTALAFVIFFALIREVGPARAVVFTYVNPAVAVLAGVVFLGEPFTPTIVSAFVLILGGSILAMSRQPAGPPAPSEVSPPVAEEPFSADRASR